MLIWSLLILVALRKFSASTITAAARRPSASGGRGGLALALQNVASAICFALAVDRSRQSHSVVGDTLVIDAFHRQGRNTSASRPLRFAQRQPAEQISFSRNAEHPEKPRAQFRPCPRKQAAPPRGTIRVTYDTPSEKLQKKYPPLLESNRSRNKANAPFSSAVHLKNPGRLGLALRARVLRAATPVSIPCSDPCSKQAVNFSHHRRVFRRLGRRVRTIRRSA